MVWETDTTMHIIKKKIADTGIKHEIVCNSTSNYMMLSASQEQLNSEIKAILIDDNNHVNLYI